MAHEKSHPIQGKYASKNHFSAKITAGKGKEYDFSSSVEKLHDSLDDQTALDSGLGSSSEYKTKVSP